MTCHKHLLYEGQCNPFHSTNKISRERTQDISVLNNFGVNNVGERHFSAYSLLIKIKEQI
jgi:hypothetical protein